MGSCGFFVLYLTSKLVYMHICHALVIKFLMTLMDFKVFGNASMFSLSRVAKEKILSVIASMEVE